MDADRIPGAERMLLLAGATLVIVLSSFGITQFPLPWWDEGWTLSVAKNWVTLGHYGHMLNGAPAGPSLSAHLPVVAIVAAAFLAFGVGLAQARMAMIVCTAITLVLVYLLTRRLYSRTTALIAAALVCVAPTQWDLSALFVGRNVLGEIPSLMFILLGVHLYLRSGGVSRMHLVAAGGAFGLALATKAQVVPFVVTALAVTAGLQLIRHRQAGIATGAVLAIALLVMFLIGWVKTVFLASPGMPADPVSGLTEVTAVVFDPDIRFATIRFALLTGASVSIGLGAAAVRAIRAALRPRETPWADATRTFLTVVAGSWFAWFILLSIGWGRYGFPAFFLAAPFTADLILRLFRRMRARAHTPREWSYRTGAALLLVFFMAMTARQMWIGARAMAEPRHDSGLEETAAFVNHATPPGSVIETYESELLFVLERPVHMPPAQLNVDLIRKNWLKGPATLGYDLSSVRARYLIIGTFGSGVYDSLLADHRYQPVRQCGGYTIYRRTGNAK